ncbi:MAG: Cof-type HAD-IIB family hydrolase [Clostridiales Family XIII bacterium]|jgi:Cof subfamily protein (haloacid dehalogenase superfamily)|nr:Cof-type HAD-IIB family hydrolase [Clostridiales Family XIII bacterium]
MTDGKLDKTGDFEGKIKLVATDLDGTLLSREMELSEENRRALVRCIDRGIHVIVATGRSRSSVPQAVRYVDGIEYLICANGAKIYDNRTNEQLYARYLSREAMESVWEIIAAGDIMCEVFYDGTPYISAACYNDLARYGVPEWFADYVRKSRVPVDDLPAFTSEHMDVIENVNFNYGSDGVSTYLRGRLGDSALYELTTSLPFNYEIGGLGVNKAEALDFLCDRLHIAPAETMCIGDNANDVGMLRYAGIGVAMGDAVPAAQEAADFVTLDSAQNGVAHAIDRFVRNG